MATFNKVTITGLVCLAVWHGVRHYGITQHFPTGENALNACDYRELHANNQMFMRYWNSEEAPKCVPAKLPFIQKSWSDVSTMVKESLVEPVVGWSKTLAQAHAPLMAESDVFQSLVKDMPPFLYSYIPESMLSPSSRRFTRTRRLSFFEYLKDRYGIVVKTVPFRPAAGKELPFPYSLLPVTTFVNLFNTVLKTIFEDQRLKTLPFHYRWLVEWYFDCLLKAANEEFYSEVSVKLELFSRNIAERMDEVSQSLVENVYNPVKPFLPKTLVDLSEAFAHDMLHVWWSPSRSGMKGNQVWIDILDFNIRRWNEEKTSWWMSVLRIPVVSGMRMERSYQSMTRQSQNWCSLVLHVIFTLVVWQASLMYKQLTLQQQAHRSQVARQRQQQAGLQSQVPRSENLDQNQSPTRGPV